jgi:hypothetical protein
MMDSPRWAQVQKLFAGAVDLPRSDQQIFLARECGGDLALMDEVRR